MKASRGELVALKADLERALADSEAEARRQAMEEAKRVVEAAGFSMRDLFGNPNPASGTALLQNSVGEGFTSGIHAVRRVV